MRALPEHRQHLGQRAREGAEGRHHVKPYLPLGSTPRVDVKRKPNIAPVVVDPVQTVDAKFRDAIRLDYIPLQLRNYPHRPLPAVLVLGGHQGDTHQNTADTSFEVCSRKRYCGLNGRTDLDHSQSIFFPAYPPRIASLDTGDSGGRRVGRAVSPDGYGRPVSQPSRTAALAPDARRTGGVTGEGGCSPRSPTLSGAQQSLRPTPQTFCVGDDLGLAGAERGKAGGSSLRLGCRANAAAFFLFARRRGPGWHVGKRGARCRSRKRRTPRLSRQSFLLRLQACQDAPRNRSDGFHSSPSLLCIQVGTGRTACSSASRGQIRQWLK